MARTTRHSRRKHDKDRRKKARKNRKRSGQKAGSIAIHSRLPGLEGTELGSMEVIVDTRRKEMHPAEISVIIYNRAHQRTLHWRIETGFGGQAARVGFQTMADDPHAEQPPTRWVYEVADNRDEPEASSEQARVSPGHGDTR